MKQKRLVAVKILCACILPLLLLAPSPRYRIIHARCERVLDGDTVKVLYGRRLLKLRLAMIDAPELKQEGLNREPIGKNSQKFLEALVLDERLKVRVLKKDRYGRYLARLYHKGVDVNLRMVESGQALIYRYYEFENVRDKIEYMGAEMAAKRRRIGVWGSFGFYDPYAYRRMKRRGKR